MPESGGHHEGRKGREGTAARERGTESVYKRDMGG